MKVPLEWLKEYVNLEGLSPKDIGEAFTQIGLMLDKPFDGKVFDLEHRFDRSDWLSILGCARDLAAFLERELFLPKTYKNQGKQPDKSQIVDIKVECPEVINRFNTRVFRNITVKPSPDWLSRRLELYGIPSINNVVDITNYVMVELGQPMHAQDLSKFRKQEIVIRKARDEEKIVTFLGDEVNLYSEAFVLTQNGVPTVLGGIVGGIETGVDQNTKDIILDAGNYDQKTIRKVSRRLKIQNETVLRYDKFLHPNLTQHAIERAAYLILELAGGEYYENIDWNPKETKPKLMHLHYKRILQVGGFLIPKEKIEDILIRLDYEIKSNDDEKIELIVPYFRTDIEVEDDIVSDILRIYGYSKIPSSQIQVAPPKETTPKIYNFEEKIKDIMVQLGGHEHITDPLVLGDSYADNPPNAYAPDETKKQIVLENSLNSQKNALRTDIAETLKEIIPNYTKNKIPSGVLFEVGKIYTQEGDGDSYESYKEKRVLECLIFDEHKLPKEIFIKTSSILSGLLKNLGLENYTLTKINQRESHIFAKDKMLGSLRYNGFTLFTEELMEESALPNRILTTISEQTTLDLSLFIPMSTPVGQVIQIIRSESLVSKVEFLEEYLDKTSNEGLRSVLLRIYFTNGTTLEKAKELTNSIVKKLEQEHKVKLRSS